MYTFILSTHLMYIYPIFIQKLHFNRDIRSQFLIILFVFVEIALRFFAVRCGSRGFRPCLFEIHAIRIVFDSIRKRFGLKSHTLQK